jgi:hypothetical protein
MSDLQIHANEVRNCKACYQRVVWLKNSYNRYTLFNVPDSESGKSWLTIDDKGFHDCANKERLAFLKEQRTTKRMNGER